MNFSLPEIMLMQANLDRGLLEFYKCPACGSNGLMVHITDKASQEYIKKQDEVLKKNKNILIGSVCRFFYKGDCADCGFETESYDSPEEVFDSLGMQKKDNAKEVERLRERIKEGKDFWEEAAILISIVNEKFKERHK